MDYYPSLKELLHGSPKSKELYSSLSPEGQISLQVHQQTIHTYADLQKIAMLFDANPRRP